MAVVMADDSAEKVFRQILVIADQESDYPPLTKEEWHRVKSCEEEAEKAHPTLEIRKYFQDIRLQEEEGKQEEQMADEKIPQQHPRPWPMLPCAITKGNSWQTPQRQPLPLALTEDNIPQEPLPPPPPTNQQEDDKMVQQQPNPGEEPQTESQAGKRQK